MKACGLVMSKFTWKSERAIGLGAMTGPGHDLPGMGLGLNWVTSGLPCCATMEEFGEAKGIGELSSLCGEANGLCRQSLAGLCANSPLPKLDSCCVTASTPPLSTVIITQIISDNNKVTTLYFKVPV